VTPVATAITSIDFDHQALLGNTLREIAREKAGIIKSSVPVVLGPLPRDAEEEVCRIAADRDAPVLRGREMPDANPALRGRHQRENTAVTAALADVLNARGIAIPASALREGIEQVDWPARLELVTLDDTEFLLDAAHNPAGARALAEFLRDSGWSGAALLFGAMKDKDADGMLRELAPVMRHIVCTTAGSPRAADAESLASAARIIAAGPSIHVEAEPARALARARTLSSRVVIAGSMFLVGPLRGILRGAGSASPLRAHSKHE
jgi:dihydrofolate synthase/folylpolyglutamate synthase